MKNHFVNVMSNFEDIDCFVRNLELVSVGFDWPVSAFGSDPAS